MTDDITKLQRWLDVIAYLVGRRLPVSVDELMGRIPAYAEKWRGGDETSRATARRTFERDKRELRKAGIPIETVTYTVDYGSRKREGYRLARSDFYLPYLEIASRAGETGDGGAGEADEGEAGADVEGGARNGDGAGREDGADAGVPEIELGRADVGTAVDALERVLRRPSFPFEREARSALRKLTFDLVDDDLGSTPVLYPDRPDAGEVADRLRELAGALLDRKRVRFRYRGIRRGEATDRDVAPYGLFFQHGEWYLVGGDAVRDGEIRVFRVDRMEALEPEAAAPQTPDYEVPEDFEVRRYLDREAWELGERDQEEVVDAEVLFRFPASLRVRRRGRGETVEIRDDGAVVRRFRVRQVGPFVRWLMTFRGDAEVVSPPELRRELGTVAAEVARLYGDEGADASRDGGR